MEGRRIASIYGQLVGCYSLMLCLFFGPLPGLYMIPPPTHVPWIEVRISEVAAVQWHDSYWVKDLTNGAC